jgi:mono/diheme cytochrome c family protein
MRWKHVAVAAMLATLGDPGLAEAGGDEAEAALAQALLNGYRRYNSACNHCHGPDGIGSTFAPSLIDQPLPYPEFLAIVEQGSARGVSVMRGFADDPNVAPYVRDMWLYLEARADGTLGRGRPVPAP